jgi:hypothetical protein
LTLLLLGLVAGVQPRFADRPIVLDGASDRYARQFVFLATDYGIYAFNRDAQTLARLATPAGHDDSVSALGLDDGVLWVAGAKGLASADVRVNDWRTYELGGAVSGLAFDRRYVWAGGDFGLKRLDKFAETWEQVADFRVNDVLADGRFLWLATASGVRRYNPEFERIEEVPVPAGAFSRIVNTPGRVWFLGLDSLRSLSRSTDKWTAYAARAFEGFSVFGDSLFAVDDGRVWRYEPGADIWAVVTELEPVPAVRAVQADNQGLALATGLGLVNYDWSSRSIVLTSRKDGLPDDSLVGVWRDSRSLLVASRQSIELRNPDTKTWQAERLVRSGARTRDIVALDDAGAHLRALPGVDVRLSGRASWSGQTRVPGSGLASQENVNLGLTAEHRTGRTGSLFYDDSDKDQVMYGLTYRGRESDLLPRAAAGRLGTEYADFNVIPGFAMLGGRTRLRYRSQDLNLQAGMLQSQRRSEFFTGQQREHELAVRDIDYLPGTFFRIDARCVPVTAAADTVFVDDRSAASNGPGTRTGATRGGITGDFDVLIDGQDYFLDRARGRIQFAARQPSQSIIVLAFDGQDIVIQSDAVRNSVQENVYRFGREITPGSFELDVRDTLGTAHPLSEFGLDADGDGRIDPGFLNADLGYLTFPADRPFPDPVYDETVNVFTLNARYRTESPLYWLAHTPIERNSDEVTVDGDALARGSDYVIDYSSGVLLILRPDLVSEHSRIAVQYSSVERSQRALAYSAQANLHAARGVEVNPGFTGIDQKRFGHLSGRLELGKSDRHSLRMVPQIAVNTAGALAQNHTLNANYGILSSRVEYSAYSPEFEAFGADTTQYGRLRHRIGGAFGLEPVPQLRADVRYRRELLGDSLRSAEYASGKVSFRRTGLPGGQFLVGQDRLPDAMQRRARLGADYEVTLLRSRVQLSGFAQGAEVETQRTQRNMEDTESSVSSRTTPRPLCSVAQDQKRDTVVNYLVDAGLTLPIAIAANVRYSQDRLFGSLSNARVKDQCRVRLNVDAIPGISCSGSYELDDARYDVSGAQDVELEHSLHTDLHVAPGRWWSHLSIVNLSAGAGQDFDEYLEDVAASYRPPRLAIEPVAAGVVSHVNQLNTRYAQVQVTPSASLLVRARLALNQSGACSYGLPQLRSGAETDLRVEYEPAWLGSLVAVWNRKDNPTYPALRYDNFYLEWNRPWSQAIHLRATANYNRATEDWAGTVTRLTQDMLVSPVVILYFGAKSSATLTVKGRRQWSHSASADYSVMPGANLNLNLLRFLHVVLDYQSVLPFAGSASHILTARLTAQF